MKRNLYESDFYAWTITQAKLLELGQFDQLDVLNLIEEMASLGRQEQRELRNHLGILLGHLLKWYYQPEMRTKSWRSRIRVQRMEILQHLKDNPSLKSYLPEAMRIGYQQGLALIDEQTPLNSDDLPQICPFFDAQIFEETIELQSFCLLWDTIRTLPISMGWKTLVSPELFISHNC